MEVRHEDDSLAGFWTRLDLVAGYAARHTRWDPAARVEPVDVITGDISGAFPASSGNVIRVHLVVIVGMSG